MVSIETPLMSKDINLLFERFGRPKYWNEGVRSTIFGEWSSLFCERFAEQYFYLTIAHYFPSSDSFLLFTVVSCECY